MSKLDIAWTVVAALVGLLVLGLCVAVGLVCTVITRTRTSIETLTQETVPVLREVCTTVTLVNQEIGRVDGILATAETATAAVGNVVNVVSSTVTSPLVKLSAFAWGLRRAVGKAAEEEADTAGSRRRRRRRR